MDFMSAQRAPFLALALLLAACPDPDPGVGVSGPASSSGEGSESSGVDAESSTGEPACAFVMTRALNYPTDPDTYECMCGDEKVDFELREEGDCRCGDQRVNTNLCGLTPGCFLWSNSCYCDDVLQEGVEGFARCVPPYDRNLPEVCVLDFQTFECLCNDTFLVSDPAKCGCATIFGDGGSECRCPDADPAALPTYDGVPGGQCPIP